MSQKGRVLRVPLGPAECGTEPCVAETLARALGSLATGACTLESFPDLVGIELAQKRSDVPDGVSSEEATCMLEGLRAMMQRVDGLAPGESMEVQFDEAP